MTELEKAYKMVYDDLKSMDLFTGDYDATNGSEDFMYGIETVMETIVNKTGSDLNFVDEFFDRMDASKRKARSE